MQLLPAFAGMPDLNKVYNCDAFTLLAALPDASVDAFITDLPYGTTACSWDEIIPFAPMWAEVKRTLKPRGVFVTTASQPFTSKLVMSNVIMFKYSWVWDKVKPGNILAAKYQPLKNHEDVCVFSIDGHNYYPSMTASRQRNYKMYSQSKTIGKELERVEYTSDVLYPKSIITFSNADQTERDHPTQKPVALYEYLIRTYTQPGDLVVDFCCGSGTTALAARNLNRNYIVGDITPQYVEVARKRLAEAYTPLMPIFLEQESA